MSTATLKGAPVSAGIAIGKAFHYRPLSYTITPASCPPEKVGEELARFQSALDTALEEIDAIGASFDESQADKAMIFAAHRELLSDEELLEMINEGIEAECRKTEYAVDAAFSEFIELLSGVDDPLIAARTADLKDVRNRLLRILHGDEERNLSHLPGDVVIVAHDLLPSDTATLDKDHVLGILTEVGSSTSHSAIIARSMRIPAILGIPGALESTWHGQMLILDALEGSVILSPGEDAIAEYQKREADFRAKQAITDKYLDAEPRTKDGQLVSVGLNIGSDAPNDHYKYVDFVGLFRTEFLYMESDHLPTEEEQFQAYKRVLENAGCPVTLRTLDIGGDKQLPYMQLPHEENPFLGLRAIRLCFVQDALFRTQLRAAYRASAFGPLKIMFPMIGSLDDLMRAKATALAVRDELTAEGVAVGNVPLGIMIEIPSIAMIADLAAANSDFASIGTNDLCQYLCAVDRMNPTVSYSYQSYSPAMLRALKMIIDAYNAAGKPISVCGEMGGQPAAAMLLAGMGLRKLSMNGSSIAAVKEMLATHTLEEMHKAAADAINCKTEAEVLSLMNGILNG